MASKIYNSAIYSNFKILNSMLDNTILAAIFFKF